MPDQMPHDPPGAGGVWSMPVPESAFTTAGDCPEPMLNLDDAIRLDIGSPLRRKAGDHGR